MGIKGVKATFLDSFNNIILSQIEIIRNFLQCIVMDIIYGARCQTK